MATHIVTPTELHPPSDDPRKNLTQYCFTVGLEEASFVQLPGRPGVYIAAVDLTPEVCAAMENVSLARKGHNRKLRPKAVEQYRHSMNLGAFDFTGQTIIVSDSWSLLDGHHRTTAGRSAEKSFPAMVVFGIPDALFDIIDNSVGRSLADNMELSGQGRAAWLANAINLLIARERTGDPLGKLKVSITPRERRQFVVDNPDLALARDAALSIEEMVSISLPETVYVLFIARHVDPEKTQAFIDRVISGADLAETDPRLAFIKWARAAEVRRDKRQGPKRKENLVALLKSVKCFFDDTPLPKLVVSKREDLPSLS
jgi:hypothetical protein